MQRGFADDRLLLIGPTDADLGCGRVWDVALVPAVEIDGGIHIDGGIATNLLAGDLQFMRALSAALRARGETAPVTVQMYVIVNLYLAPPVQTVNPASAPAMTARATGLLFALHPHETLTRLWEVSEAVNAGVPGLNVEFNFAAIPDVWAAEQARASCSRRLHEQAAGLRRGARAWRGPVGPAPARPVRVGP